MLVYLVIMIYHCNSSTRVAQKKKTWFSKLNLVRYWEPILVLHHDHYSLQNYWTLASSKARERKLKFQWRREKHQPKHTASAKWHLWRLAYLGAQAMVILTGNYGPYNMHYEHNNSATTLTKVIQWVIWKGRIVWFRNSGECGRAPVNIW